MVQIPPESFAQTHTDRQHKAHSFYREQISYKNWNNNE